MRESSKKQCSSESHVEMLSRIRDTGTHVVLET